MPTIIDPEIAEHQSFIDMIEQADIVTVESRHHNGLEILLLRPNTKKVESVKGKIISCDTYVINKGRYKNIVVDPGYPLSLLPYCFAYLNARFGLSGMHPILLTHRHPDHMYGIFIRAGVGTLYMGEEDITGVLETAANPFSLANYGTLVKHGFPIPPADPDFKTEYPLERVKSIESLASLPIQGFEELTFRRVGVHYTHHYIFSIGGYCFAGDLVSVVTLKDGKKQLVARFDLNDSDWQKYAATNDPDILTTGAKLQETNLDKALHDIINDSSIHTLCLGHGGFLLKQELVELLQTNAIKKVYPVPKLTPKVA
ncbi:MBL fold metallo-hydrolase [Candidatus Woesearchaeota archaeon]|nr:MBL fold metallo-hydrolase [Candidatus Woesearchaeota archaeon]